MGLFWIEISWLDFVIFFFQFALIVLGLFIDCFNPFTKKTSSEVADVNFYFVKPSFLNNPLQLWNLSLTDLLWINILQTKQKILIQHALPGRRPILLFVENNHHCHQNILNNISRNYNFPKFVYEFWFDLRNNLLRNTSSRNWKATISFLLWDMILFWLCLRWTYHGFGAH